MRLSRVCIVGPTQHSTSIKGGSGVSRRPTGQPAAITAWRSCVHSLNQKRPIVAAVVATSMCSVAVVSCCLWVVRRRQTAATLRSLTSLPHKAERISRLVKVNLPVMQTALQTAGAPVTSEPHRASRRKPRPSHLVLLLPGTLGTLTHRCCVSKCCKDKCKKKTNNYTKEKERERRLRYTTLTLLANYLRLWTAGRMEEYWSWVKNK